MSLPGRIVVNQIILGLVCALAFLLILEWRSSRSALLAMMCTVLPTAYYAWVQARTYSATRMLAHGVMRMLLTMTLMAVSIIVLHIEPLGFFVTFAVMQLAYLFAGKFTQSN